MKYNIFKVIDGIKEKQEFDVEIINIQGGLAQVSVDGINYDVAIENYPAKDSTIVQPQIITRQVQPTITTSSPKPQVVVKVPPAPIVSAADSNILKAPIPGLILEVKVNVGDSVRTGQVVAIMEAMKMENNLLSNATGVVKEIRVRNGSQINTGDIIMVIGSL